ncbi:MAG: hypothetical protein AAGG01_13050 [Planctomycetota bacterium]
MTRLTLITSLSALAALLVPTSTAQETPLTLAAQKAPSPTRHAGIYHVTSGTWTRTPATTAAFGPDVIYSNTAP